MSRVGVSKTQLRRHRVILRLSVDEWGQLRRDAEQLELSVDQLLSMIVSVRCRARVLGSATQALNELLDSLDEPDPGSARWNDLHRPFGPDTTMA